MFKETFRKYGQVFLVLLLLITIYFAFINFSSIKDFFGNLFSILAPFFLGLLFTFLLYMPSKGLEAIFTKSKFKPIRAHKRGISIFICYLIALIIIALFLKFAIPTIYDNLSELVSNIPTFYNNSVDYLKNIPEDSFLYGIDFTNILDNISIDKLQGLFNLDTLWASLKGVIDFASAIFSLFVGIILSVYILLDREKILAFFRRFCCAVFGEKTEKNIFKYLEKLTTIFFKFITGQFLDAILVGTLSTIVLVLLDVKYALILGPLIGLANMIPYFGAIFATIFSILITLFTGGFWKAFAVLVFILILQQIDANVINPKILSDNLKISPLLVIFAVTVGGGLFGVIGMFLGVPIIAMFKAIIMDYIEYKENISVYKNNE